MTAFFWSPTIELDALQFQQRIHEGIYLVTIDVVKSQTLT